MIYLNEIIPHNLLTQTCQEFVDFNIMAYRPSYAQIETLVDFLEANPGIAKGLLKTYNGRSETRKKWTEIATSLNALGGANKDGQGWAKYWSEKKCALKKQCAQASASLRRTGGGPGDNTHSFSPLELRMIEIMGGAQFATGDSQFSVNPFPLIRNSDSQTRSANDQNDTRPEQEIIIEHEVADELEDPLFYQSPPESLPENTQQISQTPPHSNQPVGPHRRRPIRRRTAVANAEADMERLARIEERRVNAEATTAQAFADFATTFSANTAALERIAGALTCIANAIERFCNNSRPPIQGPPHSHDYF